MLPAVTGFRFALTSLIAIFRFVSDQMISANPSLQDSMDSCVIPGVSGNAGRATGAN